MIGERIVFQAPWKAAAVKEDFDITLNGPDDAIIETEYSVISPGTELAILSGGESWAPLPITHGYGAVGRIVAKGENVKSAKIGDRVFTYSKHQAYDHFSRVLVPVPEGLSGPEAVFARIAAIAITSLRVSAAELGDWVAVFGMGLVGNLAAQLFQIAGCRVIAIDVNPKRLDLAKKLGIERALAPSDDMKAQIRELTGGEMCATVVEATGNPAVAAVAADIAGKLGEVVLLGSPRGECVRDLTPILNKCHLFNNGCVTFKGAHEWRYPLKSDEKGLVKHSIERNVKCLFALIAGGKLKTKELISHVLAPKECGAAYLGLKEKPDEYLGVVYDWSK